MTEPESITAGLLSVIGAAQAAWESRDPSEEQARLAERDRRLAAYGEKLWRARYRLAAPVRVADAAWSPLETPAVKAVRGWLPDTSRHLVLRGGVGCGKSSAACVAVKHWVEPVVQLDVDGCVPVTPVSDDARVYHHNVAWLRPQQLVSAVLHSYDENAPKLHKYVVLDDIGLETSTDFEVALCELLDRAEHVLLITTNLTRAKFRDRYGLRLLDRLNGMATAVDLPQQSMRAQDGGF